MNTPTFPSLQTRYKRSAARGYFAAHPISQIARSLFATSILWTFIAVAVYTVYTMLVPAH